MYHVRAEGVDERMIMYIIIIKGTDMLLLFC